MAGEKRQRCPKCGSGMITVRGRWVCLLCSTEKRNKAESHEFYEVNKLEIQDDIRRHGTRPTLAKWRIPHGTLGKLCRRWGFKLSRDLPVPTPQPVERLIPGLPPWSDTWPEVVQLKWLEILQERLK